MVHNSFLLHRKLPDIQGHQWGLKSGDAQLGTTARVRNFGVSFSLKDCSIYDFGTGQKM